jgi:energy-coupling factor transport system permease protein
MINPLCKVLALLVFILMVMIGSCFRVMFGLSIILLFIIVLSNVSLKKYFLSIYSMKFLLIFVFLINLLFGVSIYDSFIMILRICFVVLYSSVLLYTTTTNELALGFSSLFEPLGFFGFPVSKVSMAIALSLNFVPLLFIESSKIIRSQASRGFNYKNGSIKDKIVGLKSVFIPMFVLSIRRADCISDAMEVKNFSFDCRRSNFKGIHWCMNDICMIACHLFVLIFVLIKEVVL